MLCPFHLLSLASAHTDLLLQETWLSTVITRYYLHGASFSKFPSGFHFPGPACHPALQQSPLLSATAKAQPPHNHFLLAPRSLKASFRLTGLHLSHSPSEVQVPPERPWEQLRTHIWSACCTHDCVMCKGPGSH